MFTFEDLASLERAALQKIMREVEMRDLAVALKVASSNLQETLLACVSKRAAAAVKEEIDLLGSVKKCDVEAAQRRIIESVRRLESEGEVELVNLAGAGRS
jgi:flagellar motor switch protein FliG